MPCALRLVLDQEGVLKAKIHAQAVRYGNDGEVKRARKALFSSSSSSSSFHAT